MRNEIKLFKFLSLNKKFSKYLSQTNFSHDILNVKEGTCNFKFNFWVERMEAIKIVDISHISLVRNGTIPASAWKGGSISL